MFLIKALQTSHIPSMFFFIVCVCLKVVGVSNLALRDPLSTLELPPQAYTPPYSLILRYGVATMLWLSIGLLQVNHA